MRRPAVNPAAVYMKANAGNFPDSAVPEKQLAESEECCKNKRPDVGARYGDDLESREEFQRMMADATGGNAPFDHAVVWNLRYFAWSLGESVLARETLAANGVRDTVKVDLEIEPGETEQPTQEFVIGSQIQATITSAHVANASESKLTQGCYRRAAHVPPKEQSKWQTSTRSRPENGSQATPCAKEAEGADNPRPPRPLENENPGNPQRRTPPPPTGSRTSKGPGINDANHWARTYIRAQFLFLSHPTTGP